MGKIPDELQALLDEEAEKSGKFVALKSVHDIARQKVINFLGFDLTDESVAYPTYAFSKMPTLQLNFGNGQSLVEWQLRTEFFETFFSGLSSLNDLKPEESEKYVPDTDSEIIERALWVFFDQRLSGTPERFTFHRYLLGEHDPLLITRVEMDSRETPYGIVVSYFRFWKDRGGRITPI